MNLIGLRESEVREWLAEHRNSDNAREASDFLNRRGRFSEMELSTSEREQVFPGPLPANQAQTHRGREYRDGS